MGKIIYASTELGQMELSLGLSLGGFGLSLAFAIAIYLLRSIGVYTLAKRNGVPKAGFAWFPGLWIYPVCLLVGEFRFFGRTYKSLARLITVAITASAVISIIYNILIYFPVVVYFLQGGIVYLGDGEAVAGLVGYGNTYLVYSSLTEQFFNYVNVIEIVLTILNLFNYFLQIVEAVVTLNVFLSLFRKFSPKHYILFAILSFFGLFPIFVFAIRKKAPIDYASYMRARYTVYTNNPNNYYNYSNQQSPFEEYPNQENKKTKYEDPFEEFSDKK